MPSMEYEELVDVLKKVSPLCLSTLGNIGRSVPEGATIESALETIIDVNSKILRSIVPEDNQEAFDTQVIFCYQLDLLSDALINEG